MARLFIPSLLSILFLFPVMAQNAAEKNAAEPQPVIEEYKPDVDLESAPEFYRKRVIAFRNLLRKEPDRSAKVAKALALAKDRKSAFRKDALNFLGTVRAKSAAPELIKLLKDREVREFVLFALSEIRVKEAIPYFIRYLGDSSENVRGNAQQALGKYVPMKFAYQYSDPLARRKEDIKAILKWWKINRDRFQLAQDTEEEATLAEKEWERYGHQYLHDLSR